jgi:hypothetical protein
VEEDVGSRISALDEPETTFRVPLPDDADVVFSAPSNRSQDKPPIAAQVGVRFEAQLASQTDRKVVAALDQRANGCQPNRQRVRPVA